MAAEVLVGVLSLIVGTFEFALSLKSYITDRKRRKRLEQQQQQQITAPAATPPPTIVYYSICSTFHNCTFFPPPHNFHPPIALPFTSSPPASSHHNSAFISLPNFYAPLAEQITPPPPPSCYNIAPATWCSPPAPNFYPPFAEQITHPPPRYNSAPATRPALNFYPPLAEQITPPPRRYNSSAPATRCSLPAPNLYPPLAQPLTSISPLPALSHCNSAPASSFSHFRDTAETTWRNYLDGSMALQKPQQAPHPVHGTFGMRTGACLNNRSDSCFDHWMWLQEVSIHGIVQLGSIAVVDWSRCNIDMFVKMDGVYFRNYRIKTCDVLTFAHRFKTKEVFSGEIKEQKLERFNVPMEMVDMTGTGVRSTNSWRSLGIDDESEDMQDVLHEGVSFVRMRRGAVFGLVCCLYEDPSQLNVGMENSAHSRSAGSLDIVRITTLPRRIVKRNACIFSTFSFCDDGWASEDILLG